MSRRLWTLLVLLVSGCGAHPLPWVEQPWDYRRDPLDKYAAACSPSGNRGQLWGGWYVPNRAMARRLLDLQGIAGVCEYDELVLGCHPDGMGITGYPSPIPMGACIPEFPAERRP